VLPVSQRIAAGASGTALAAGTAARIFTGAPVPDGADAILMQEDCELLAADGLDVSVVNCRYMKPYDEVTLNAILASHTHVLTVEEGTVVNGFGAFISSIVHQLAPTVRTTVHGVPDRIIYSAPRKKQLASLGLDPAGIAERVRAFHESEALAG
jgi:1-deoxy-D-xylulose-5-phosphate synthase